MKSLPNRRNLFFLSILPLILFFLSEYHLIFSLDKKPPGYNILLITIDTIRPDRLSCYSQEYLQTVHIDSLAKKGAVFARAFAHNPMTLPSHVNILLGTTPLYHGVHDNSNFVVSEKFLTLAEYLKSEGYSTSSVVGAFPLDSRFGLSQGFDIYDDSYPSKPFSHFFYAERKAELVIDRSLEWLKKQTSKWFSWIHIWDPHQPYLPPEPFKSTFKNDLYSGEAAYVDFELGKLFGYLERNGLMQNTVIILTGDHGESLHEHGESTHGYFAYNSTLWIPLIIAGPGIRPSRIDDYVSHVDIFPTVCDILNLEKPSFLQGVSLLPLINGEKIKKRAIYFESLNAYYNCSWAPLRGFIEEGDKFISSPIPELYNIKDDFDEKTNLALKANLERYREKLKEIDKKFSSSEKTQSIRIIDREAQQKLKSLGYLVSPLPQLKKDFTPEEDLKILLPFQNKFTAAGSLYEEGKVEEGIRLLNEIIQTRKDFAMAYNQLSIMYKSQGRIKEALEIMEEGFKNNPKNFIIISNYGILLVEVGKFDEAIEFLQKGIDLRDYDPEIWNYLGVAFWRKGEFQKALEAYKKVLSLDHNYAIAYNNLGSLYLSIFSSSKRTDAYDQSVEYFRKAIELDPTLASAYNGLGGAFKNAGKIDEAISMWKKSLELNPDYDFPVYNLGIAYLERGNKAQALEYFQEYLSLRKDTVSPEELRKIENLIQECKKE